MKVVAIIQARMGSTRLPGKVLMDVGGRPMLAFMLERLQRATMLNEIWVATSARSQDDPIVSLCTSLGTNCHRGPEDDVLERYRQTAGVSGADVIVRLTADCPLICPEVVDKVAAAFMNAAPPVDYASNCICRTYPRGLDTEAVSRGALDVAAIDATDPADREHVTYFIWRQPKRFQHLSVEDFQNHSDLRWTVDTPEDMDLIRRIEGELGAGAGEASYGDLLDLIVHHPEWSAINARVEQKVVAP